MGKKRPSLLWLLVACWLLVYPEVPVVSQAAGKAPAAPVFVRAYYGRASGNPNRSWAWRPGDDAPVDYYIVAPDWRKPYTVTQPSTLLMEPGATWQKDPPRLSEGMHRIGIAAANAAGKSPFVWDTITVQYKRPDNDQTNHDMGVGTVRAVLPPGARNVTGVRYKQKVLVNHGNDKFKKILFGACMLDGGPNMGGYGFGVDMFSSRSVYRNDLLVPYGSPMGEMLHGETCVTLQISDFRKTGKVGFWTADPVMFPRRTALKVDGMAGTFRNDMVAQVQMDNVEIAVTIVRGGIVQSLLGWRVDGLALPRDTYREWLVTIAFGGREYHMSVAVPDERAKWLSNWQIIAWTTEFFPQTGLFTARMWDVEYQTEGSATWERMANWKVAAFDGYEVDYGFRIFTEGNVRGIEVSNIAPGDYMSKGTEFSL